MSVDVNECLKSNGGCHSKRKCMNTAGSMKCGNCPSGYANDGAKGCKGALVGEFTQLLSVTQSLGKLAGSY